MCAAVPDDGEDQFLELALTGFQLVQPVQDDLGLLFLADPVVGQPVAVREHIAHGGPEVLLLDHLVPGLGDDERLDRCLAGLHVLIGGAGVLAGAVLQPRQHLLDLFMVLAEHREYVGHGHSLFLVPRHEMSARVPARAGQTTQRAGNRASVPV